MAISYLLDEHIPDSYRFQLMLRDESLIVWGIGDPGAPARGTSDPEILRWCELHGFVLVTYNRKSMPQHLADHLGEGRHVPGIFALHPEMSMGQIIEELLLLSGASATEEYRDLIVYLPVT